MNENLLVLPKRGRIGSQKRSVNTQRKIILSATQILAEQGFVGLTHRAVANHAKVSLAATTYYFESKSDIIADVLNSLMNANLATPSEFTQKGGLNNCTLEFIAHLCSNNRVAIVAWLEIMLGAGRQSENAAFANGWTPYIENLWNASINQQKQANRYKLPRSEMDMAIGLVLMIVALGLHNQEVISVLFENGNPFEKWAKTDFLDKNVQVKSSRLTIKAKATRRRLITATVSIIVEQGASAVNFRTIAKLAKLSPAAPAYYFTTVQELLREAQSEMFEHSKIRYKETVGEVHYTATNIDELVDLTTTIFFREATEFGAVNIANYGIWLEAARVPSLRPMIWTAIEDQAQAWQRVLNVLKFDISPLDAFKIQAIYIGKLIRIICAGSLTEDLASVRKEFSNDLYGLLKSK